VIIEMKLSLFEKGLAFAMVAILAFIVLSLFGIKISGLWWLIFAVGFFGVWCLGASQVWSTSRRMLGFGQHQEPSDPTEPKN
jgi:hypothetical protein